MAKVTTKKTPKKPMKKASSGTFSAEEKAAMRERAREARSKGDGESDVLAKIKAMREPDRTTAQRIHEIVKANAPELKPKTWYGMPAYAHDDKVVCFFQDAHKFKTRYASFGFTDKANLDDGNMWPVAFALKKLTPADEKRLIDLVKKATS